MNGCKSDNEGMKVKKSSDVTLEKKNVVERRTMNE